MTTYQYGNFAIHDGVNYYLLEKDLSLPAFKQTLFQIGRLEGVKLTGQRINEKQIGVTLKVVGASRADLEAKLDALYAALAYRQQRLTLHAEDARYYIADAVSAQARLVPGKIISTEVAITFVAQQPFAYAPASSSFSTGSVYLSAVSGSPGSWQIPGGFSLTGGGNIFARPTIQVLNQSGTNATTLSAALTNGNAYTTLSVAALPAAATAGQVFLLVSGSNSQRVTLSANALVGATSISVTSFTANYSYPVGAFCGLDIYLTGFTLVQNPDGQVLQVSGLPVQAVGNGQQLTIDCDPTTANGDTVIPSLSGSPVAFVGSFPVIEPVATTLYVTVTCSNNPTIQVIVTWTPRWLA